MKIQTIKIVHATDRKVVDDAAARLVLAGYEVKISDGKDEKKRPCVVLATSASPRTLRQALATDHHDGVDNCKKMLTAVGAAQHPCDEEEQK